MRILLLGHSLIEYGDWARLFPEHAVVNRGIAGETTSGLRRRLEREIADHPDADVVAVMSGTNDVLAGDDSFLGAYRIVARRLRKAYPAVPIVLHGLLPIDPDWLTPAALAGINAGIAELARETGVRFLDLTDRFAGPGGAPLPRLYDPDGVHLSAEGYRVWAAALREVLGI